MNSQREIQNRYAELLDVCYHQYQSGRRCKFENDEEWRYNCSNCPENNSNRFCRANLMVKKIIRLLAESMAAEGLLKEPKCAAGSLVKGAPITDEHIQNFKALNLAVALSSPKVKDTIWLVPERTGNHKFEIPLPRARATPKNIIPSGMLMKRSPYFSETMYREKSRQTGLKSLQNTG